MKFFKITGLFVLSCVVAGSGFLAHEWYGKPWFVNNFFNREVVKFALTSPETLSSIHVLENVGIYSHNAKLDNASPENADKMFVQLESAHKTLLSYDDDDLSVDEKLSKDIAIYLLDGLADAKTYRYHSYPLNQLFGAQSEFPSFMESTHEILTVDDANNYIARLTAVKQKFSEVLEGLARRESLGILPPKFVVDKVIDEMQGFVATPAKENILYVNLQTKLSETDASESEQAALLEKSEVEIVGAVYPAYTSLITYLESIQGKTTTDDGLWKLPDGAGAYKTALRFFTSTDMTADEIHNLGLSEVERIQAEVLTILAEQSYDVSQGFSLAIEEMAAKPEFYFEDSKAGREEILKQYQVILDEVDAGLAAAFSLRPEDGVSVKRIPEFKEKTSPGAYYNPPALDGSRPGQFYANLYDIKATPKYSMRTLAYHEGVPGHHFQVSIAMQLEGLPLFRRFSPFTAYVEGWALYAERLAWELGFQNDPFDNIGRLQAELFRAVRLVVDTGIHSKRWTREEAIDYMLTNTGMVESDVVAEIERYIVLPGQATAYKIGMMKILSLREKAKLEMGDKFNLSDFHSVVLKNGAVPLNILEELVDQYISDNS